MSFCCWGWDSVGRGALWRVWKRGKIIPMTLKPAKMHTQRNPRIIMGQVQLHEVILVARVKIATARLKYPQNHLQLTA